MPTIQIDEAVYIYAEHPEWLEDAFFAKGVSTELAAQIEDETWREEALSEAADAREAVAIVKSLPKLTPFRVECWPLSLEAGRDMPRAPIGALGMSRCGAWCDGVEISSGS